MVLRIRWRRNFWNKECMPSNAVLVHWIISLTNPLSRLLMRSSTKTRDLVKVVPDKYSKPIGRERPCPLRFLKKVFLHRWVVLQVCFGGTVTHGLGLSEGNGCVEISETPQHFTIFWRMLDRRVSFLSVCSKVERKCYYVFAEQPVCGLSQAFVFDF